jgi:hypothetical protein
VAAIGDVFFAWLGGRSTAATYIDALSVALSGCTLFVQDADRADDVLVVALRAVPYASPTTPAPESAELRKTRSSGPRRLPPSGDRRP